MADFNNALIERETESRGSTHRHWINLAHVIYRWTDRREPSADRVWQQSYAIFRERKASCQADLMPS